MFTNIGANIFYYYYSKSHSHTVCTNVHVHVLYTSSDERTIKCLNYTDVLEFNYHIFLKGYGFNYIKYIFF
jgi:hypothetical protein